MPSGHGKHTHQEKPTSHSTNMIFCTEGWCSFHTMRAGSSLLAQSQLLHTSPTTLTAGPTQTLCYWDAEDLTPVFSPAFSFLASSLSPLQFGSIPQAAAHLHLHHLPLSFLTRSFHLLPPLLVIGSLYDVLLDLLP